MTPDEKKKDAERRKAYNAFQKKNRKEENGAGDFGTTKLRKKYEEDTPKSVNEEMITYRVKKMQKPELDKFKRSAKMMKLKLNLDQGKDDTVIVVSGTKKNLRDFDSVVRGKSSYGDPSTIRHFDEGLKENAVLNENTIEKMREIVSKKQAMKVGGVMVDMFTASAVVQIYDKVNDANKKKMDKMKPTQLANVAYKIMQKQSVSEGNLFREYEPGEYRNGEEKMYVDLIKKNGGKNIKVAKPDRREPNLSIDFKGGNISKMRQDLDKVDDGLTNLSLIHI